MKIISSLLVITCFSQFVFAGNTGFEWKTTSPESEGMSSGKLDAAKDTLAAKGTKTLLIIKDDKIYVLELNTLPGLTTESLFPKQAQAAGASFEQLIDHLINIASFDHSSSEMTK